MSKPFAKTENSIEKRFKQRELLMKPIIKEHKKPVLVHAVNSASSFLKILNEGTIQLPNNHTSPKKCLEMEKHLNIDNTIFLSVGFVYATAYNFKFNILFDLTLLKKTKYYKRPLIYNAYKAVIDYLKKEDKDSLKKLAQKNNECKKVIKLYFETGNFEFWRIEKEVFSMINKHKKKNKLQKIIKEIEKKLYTKSYNSARRHARVNYATNKSPEIIMKKPIFLKNNDAFVGFYIKGSISQSISKATKKNYPQKALYN